MCSSNTPITPNRAATARMIKPIGARLNTPAYVNNLTVVLLTNAWTLNAVNCNTVARRVWLEFCVKPQTNQLSYVL